MTGPGAIWQQAADKWNEVHARVDEDQLDDPTPCDDWTVRELIEHAMYWQAYGGGILGAGTSPGDEWATVERAVAAAFADPANLEGVADEMGGMPKQQIAGFVIADLLVHSWDLARSIGADEMLPPAAVEATMMGLGRVPEQMLRGPNMFGPPVEVPDDASAQDRMLGFLGRQP